MVAMPCCNFFYLILLKKAEYSSKKETIYNREMTEEKKPEINGRSAYSMHLIGDCFAEIALKESKICYVKSPEAYESPVARFNRQADFN